MRNRIALIATMLLGGCATIPTPLPAIDVTAVAETEPVGTAAQDAADDPAIWRNAANPVASLIVGTDKRAGIHVYDLSGRSLSFVPAGQINNVDLRDNVQVAGRSTILVGASNRNSLTQPQLSLLLLDGATGNLTPLADLPIDATGEAYGFCLGRITPGALPHAYVVTKEGRVLELALDLSGAMPTARLTRNFGVATQPEGCVVDDRTGQLYLGEERVGIWRFNLRSATPVAMPFAMVGPESGLVADVEGLALAPEGEAGGLLIASSQGDNAYAVFDLDSGVLRGRFRIAPGTFGATSETDGIELALGDFGPQFPGGLFVAQDGNNAPLAQNFKLVSWAAVRAALGL